jgi:uncharacterized protein
MSGRSLLRLVLLSLLAVACGDDGGGPGTPDGMEVSFDRRAMLTDLADNVLVPTFQAFDARAGELDAAVEAWCAALGTAGADDARDAARAAWREAMTVWQRAEVMQVGPLAMNDGAPRDRIYSWPVVSTCAVDKDVDIYRLDPDAYDFTSRPVNRRGLDALEHLLFAPTLDHSCTEATAPVGWNDLPDADRLAARCAYAQLVVPDLDAAAGELVAAWEGGYRDALVTAGAGSSTFASAHEAVNVISDAMFYIYEMTRDMKLGEPAGISPNICSTVQEPCFEELESGAADFSREAVVANLEAFQMLFTGDGPTVTGGQSFDDFLRAVGATDLATMMEADIAAALTAARAIPGSIEQALTSDYQSIVDAHAAVKAITDQLKSQFLTVLALNIPDGAAGDND